MWAECISEFIDEYEEYPARMFDSVIDAQQFTAMLTRLEISYRVILDQPPARLKLPMQTVVILLDTHNGVRH